MSARGQVVKQVDRHPVISFGLNEMDWMDLLQACNSHRIFSAFFGRAFDL